MRIYKHRKIYENLIDKIFFSMYNSNITYLICMDWKEQENERH
ncbi:hypothetical protein HMPREF9081_1023 [Centipeda periodontii DSM 2778]|uniref:Uncharacterized protein n=1 Tax=Centipeda periodontii DSM 2778 TaxID=888060 RepID=F5RL56_9FIRM|nr:hypothetical protein HMPREF9081_1023 [Centipeda periodontii DSM 2778]